MFSFIKLFSSNVRYSCNKIRQVSSDTIFALSSGYGKCGVAVIRVSGRHTLKVVNQIAHFREPPKPRHAFLRKLWHPISGELIDKGLVLWFPGPASFTGEDSCEFQVHGGSAVIQSMLNALGSIDGLKPAKPGEFTKRAFYCGKLDLTEVEGLADLIHSETEAQRKQALLQANGTLSKLYQKWCTQLIREIAHLEAFIDFSEDQNIEENILENLNKNVQLLENEILLHLNDNRKGERLRHGVRAVILGSTNVGKSSFLNIICQKSISIVTNLEGTTRDIIESFYNIQGYPIILVDTAGLRPTTDLIEIEGISRARNYAELADFIIILIDAKKFITSYGEDKDNKFDLREYKKQYLIELGLNLKNFKDENIMMVLNKIDLLTEIQEKNIINRDHTIFVSCKNNTGISNAVDQIGLYLKNICGVPSAECPTISQERHRKLLTECVNYLQEYRTELSPNQDLAIAAQKLRLSLRSLGQITGDVSTEDILDVIFKDFCIGK